MTGTGSAALRRRVALVFAVLALGTADAAQVVVEGSAPIRDDDLGQARALATRRAIARAAEAHAASVSAHTTLSSGLALEAAQLSASACTRDVTQLDERISDDQLTVTLQLTVADAGRCSAVCQRSLRNRLVVTGFAFEFPEQLLASEAQRIERLTANELARALLPSRRVLAEHAGTSFPYVSGQRAPEPVIDSDGSETPFAALARGHRAQYVVSGVYRDFALSGGNVRARTRTIEIEAFVHDGVTGAVLASRRFATTAQGAVVIAHQPTIGSPAFYAGDLGRAWGRLLKDIASWVELQTACLPFVARVVRTDGSLIHLDAGADAHLNPGDTLALQIWQGDTLRGLNDQPLGREKRVHATALIRAVYAQFSVAELIEAPPVLKVEKGDLVYAY